MLHDTKTLVHPRPHYNNTTCGSLAPVTMEAAKFRSAALVLVLYINPLYTDGHYSGHLENLTFRHSYKI